VVEPRAGSRHPVLGGWDLGPRGGLAENRRWSSRWVPLRWSVRWLPP